MRESGGSKPTFTGPDTWSGAGAPRLRAPRGGAVAAFVFRVGTAAPSAYGNAAGPQRVSSKRGLDSGQPDSSTTLFFLADHMLTGL